MTKKKRQKARRKKHTKRPRPAAIIPGIEPYRSSEIRRDLLRGAVFILIVLTIKIGIEHTPVGKHLELMGYNLLQTQLSSERAPVAIVDISDLRPKDFVVDGEIITATPREPLQQAIEAIAAQHPKAIGIDIDFSSDDSPYILPSDREFFEFCRSLHERTGIPVLLGVKRTIAKPAAEWLGSEKYEELAANILVPNDNLRMLYFLQMEEDKTHRPASENAPEKHKPSRAISALLADAYGNETNAATVLQKAHASIINLSTTFGLIEKFTEKSIGGGLSVHEFLVDYGPLETMEKETIHTLDPSKLQDPAQASQLNGRVVLLGDATLGKATDTFVIPARNQPFPGVFVHACAAYTLIKAPLYELTWKGHTVIDVFLSGAILLAIVLLRFRYKTAAARERASHGWQELLTLFVVIAAILVGVVSVRVTRIMWDDFFLALILLVFHPAIEQKGEHLWARIKGRFGHGKNMKAAGRHS